VVEWPIGSSKLGETIFTGCCWELFANYSPIYFVIEDLVIVNGQFCAGEVVAHSSLE
jgi:hypothetical protein